MVERDEIGGTCINTGCTPTKTMAASARVAHYARDGAKWGVHNSATQVDLAEVVARKNRTVRAWRAGQENKFRERAENIRLYRGNGCFIGLHTISVNRRSAEKASTSASVQRPEEVFVRAKFAG
jgi:pyruvate/2-oxoglutarate dehydrogenase complex dihydrolipoamide dehydrogenase (E3) component